MGPRVVEQHSIHHSGPIEVHQKHSVAVAHERPRRPEVLAIADHGGNTHLIDGSHEKLAGCTVLIGLGTDEQPPRAAVMR